MKFISSFLFLVLFVVVHCEAKTFIGKKTTNQAMRSSVRVLAVPDQFAGKRLYVDGFVRCIEGDYYLFPDSDDAVRCRFSSAMWLGFTFGSSDVELGALLYDGAWIAIEGVFRPLADNEEAGYGGGGFTDISYVQVLSYSKAEGAPIDRGASPK